MNMKAKTRKWLAAICVIAALVIVIAVPVSRRARAEEAEDSVQSIRETVMQRALQCYVIEGAYPESLDYLVENYGLAVNREDYKIVYIPYAENLPPEVKVIYKKDR